MSRVGPPMEEQLPRYRRSRFPTRDRLLWFLVIKPVAYVITSP